MSGTQDLGELMSARRADLEGRPPNANGTPEVEVIAPAEATGSETPPATGTAPVPAGPVEARQPGMVPSAPGETPDAPFPLAPPKVLGGLPYANKYSRLAFSIHQTEMVPRAFRNNPPMLMAAFMYGYEIGLGPMQAVNGINVIDGSAGLDAETMRALILEAGHIFVLQQGYNEDTGEAYATVFCRRKDWPESIPTVEFTWTSERGRRAGLVEWYEKWVSTETGRKRKLTWNPHGADPEPDWVHPDGRPSAEFKQSSAWTNYPEAMCGARATSEAARANFADVVKGLSYTPEEIREFNGGQSDMPAAPSQEVPPSPPPPSGANGQPALSQETSADTAAADTAPPPAEEKPKKAKGTTKKAAAKAETAPPSPPSSAPEPIRTENPRDLPGVTDSVPGDSSSSSPSSDTPPPDSAPPDAVQPNLEGQTQQPEQQPEPDAPTPEAGEAGVVRELATSLRALLSAKPAADRKIITAFLGQHFPGRKAEELTPEELTKAINIAAGWPGSADQYPPPQFPPTTVDGDGQPY